MLWSQHLIFSSVPLVPASITTMERVHQLVAADGLNDEDDYFWNEHWHHIASAKVTLDTKVRAYYDMRHRDIANINHVYTMCLYNMVLADRHFVAQLDMDAHMRHCYDLCTIWIDDDIAELARRYPNIASIESALWIQREIPHDEPSSMNFDLRCVLMTIQPPRCLRFLLQNRAFREEMMEGSMSPIVQRCVEELIQPTDQLDRDALLVYGQSVKLIGMCVKDEELVEVWLQKLQTYPIVSRSYISVMFARKLHALATPDQLALIKGEVWHGILEGGSNDGCFEFAWLCGLVGPVDPAIQACFLKNNVGLFPAFTFAMIVAMCDGYLGFKREITTSQKLFFILMAHLPMDLQALVSLRLWGHAATVIQSDKFNRAFLTII